MLRLTLLTVLGTILLLQASNGTSLASRHSSCWNRAEVVEQSSARLWLAEKLSAASIERERAARVAERCERGSGPSSERNTALLIVAEDLVIAGELAHGAGEYGRATALVREGIQKLRVRLKNATDVDEMRRSPAQEALARAVADLKGQWPSM
jgi:hypothetical protein